MNTDMQEDAKHAAQHWDQHISRFSGRKSGLFWWDVPQIMRHINESISGDPDTDWIHHTVRQYLQDRLPLGRCLSLGCGAGQLERTLAGLNAFTRCDAYDVSEVSIGEAKRAAESAGFSHINYRVADVNLLELQPNHYDAVWVYGAMHHFRELERVSAEIRKALKPGGLLAICEYVGPRKFQFPRRQKEIADLCLRLLPKRYRAILPEAVELENQPRDTSPGDVAHPARQAPPPEQQYRTQVGFPSAEEVTLDDPSESVRSDEILPVFEKDFDFVEKKECGGNIYQFLLSGIAGNFLDDSRCSQELIGMILNIEDTLIRCGELKSDFAYIAARPRP